MSKVEIDCNTLGRTLHNCFEFRRLSEDFNYKTVELTPERDAFCRDVALHFLFIIFGIPAEEQNKKPDEKTDEKTDEKNEEIEKIKIELEKEDEII